MNLSIKILLTKLNSTKFRGQKKIHVNLSIWKVNSLIDLDSFSFLLFYSVLFYSILFYSILLYSILFYSILFYSILVYALQFIYILFHGNPDLLMKLYSILLSLRFDLRGFAFSIRSKILRNFNFQSLGYLRILRSRIPRCGQKSRRRIWWLCRWLFGNNQFFDPWIFRDLGLDWQSEFRTGIVW